MLDTTANAPASLPQQAAATAYTRCQVLSGCRPAGPRWYVVQSQPNGERRAHAALHLKGYEPYLPLITIRWRDRTWHTRPLFVGYLFCRLDLSRPWHAVRYAPGVFSLIALDGTPTPCPDAAVEALQAGDALRASPTPPTSVWAPGMPCSLAAGAMAGHQGVIISLGPTNTVFRDMALVALMMFGQLRQVAVNLDCLQPRGDT